MTDEELGDIMIDITEELGYNGAVVTVRSEMTTGDELSPLMQAITGPGEPDLLEENYPYPTMPPN